jgi:hypothetical protein
MGHLGGDQQANESDKSKLSDVVSRTQVGLYDKGQSLGLALSVRFSRNNKVPPTGPSVTRYQSASDVLAGLTLEELRLGGGTVLEVIG